MMHIVIATMQFGEGYHQGTEKYIQNLVNQLISLQIKVTILAGDPEKLAPSASHLSRITHPLYKIIKIKTSGWYSVKGIESAEYEPLLKKLTPNIVHLVNPAHIGLNIISAANKLNIKTILTITDFWWLCPKSTLINKDGKLCSGNQNSSTCSRCIAETTDSYQQIKKVPLGTYALSIGLTVLLKSKKNIHDWRNRKQLIQQTFDIIDHTIFLSKTAKKAILNEYKIKHYSVIPAGLKEAWFENIPLTQKSHTTIGFAGTIAPHKGLHILLKALQKIKQPIELIIAGTCSSLSYQKYIKTIKLKHNITWLGQLTEQEMISFIDSVGLVIVPSLSPENQPQIILEALARRKIVICSDVPGASELVDENSTYPALEHKKLRESILFLLDKNRKNVSIIRPSSVMQMVEKTHHIYRSLIQ